MKNILIILFTLFFISFSRGELQSEYAITGNQCFYLANRTITGASETTRLVLTSSNIGENLGTCCDYCTALTATNCIAWYLMNINTCIFYRSVTDISKTPNAAYYLGHASRTPFWNCNEEPNKWYSSTTLTWIRQADFLNKISCCENCLYSLNCKSWMYTETTTDCYFSTTSHLNTPSINANGFYTGYVTPSFKSF